MHSVKWFVGLGAALAVAMASPAAHAQSVPDTLEPVRVAVEPAGAPPDSDCMPLIVETHGATTLGEIRSEGERVTAFRNTVTRAGDEIFVEHVFCVRPGREYTARARYSNERAREHSFRVDAPGARVVLRARTRGTRVLGASVNFAAAIGQFAAAGVSMAGIIGHAHCYDCNSTVWDVAALGGIAAFGLATAMYYVAIGVNRAPRFERAPLDRAAAPTFMGAAVVPVEGGAVIAAGIRF